MGILDIGAASMVTGCFLRAAALLILLAAPFPRQGLAAEGSDKSPAQPPWHAQASRVVDAQDKTFQNGPVTLSGTLYAPRSKVRVPAVIVLHSASSPDRNSPLYRHLVEMLPSLNIAVFVFDRRGTGRSGGRLEESDYELLAADGVSAQRMLTADPRIDPSRIGFWGLSQGGWLALLAASRSPRAAFAISVSAPMTTPDVQMNYAVANILRIKGYPQMDIDLAIATRTIVDDFHRGKVDRAAAQAMLDVAATKPWFEHIYVGKTLRDPEQSRWTKEMRHDPFAVIKTVKQPALLIYGSADPWVPVQLSVERLRDPSIAASHIDLVVIRGADHVMATTVPQADQIDPAVFARQAPDSVEYFGLLAAWLTKRGLASPFIDADSRRSDAVTPPAKNR